MYTARLWPPALAAEPHADAAFTRLTSTAPSRRHPSLVSPAPTYTAPPPVTIDTSTALVTVSVVEPLIVPRVAVIVAARHGRAATKSRHATVTQVGIKR